MKCKRYKIYDDMRELGSYSTLKQVYDTGLIDSSITYFYRKFSENDCYINDNICVLATRDQKARCLYLSHIINRQARLNPNTYKLDNVLTKAVKELTNCDL